VLEVCEFVGVASFVGEGVCVNEGNVDVSGLGVVTLKSTSLIEAFSVLVGNL